MYCKLDSFTSRPTIVSISNDGKHNHQGDPSLHVQHATVNRLHKFTDGEMNILKTSAAAELKSPGVTKLLEIHSPDRNFEPQTIKRALGNMKSEAKKALMTFSGGDTANLLQALAELKRRDDNWEFRAEKLPGSEYVKRIMWMSPTMKQNWEKFHDIVLFDFTAEKNEAGMPLAVVAAVDQEGK